jgi:CelD/BcsL family acetyltransferase involved in cellulose biosynthesis
MPVTALRVRMSPSAMAESIDSASELAPLEPEWEELASRVGASPFMRPGWIGAWWRAFGPGKLAILVLRRQDRLVGVLPLASQRGALVSTTNWHTPEFVPIAEDESALAALIEAALARTSVRLDLSFLYENSAAAGACVRLGQAAGFSVLSRVVQRSPYLEPRDDWDSFKAGLPSRKTHKYRRFRRRLDEQGQVSIEVVDGGERLAELLREGFEVEAAGLEGRRGKAILARPETTRFYSEVAEWAAERGWLRLGFLRLDGKPIAFAYGLEHGGVYWDLKVGFDPAHARFGPGVLLLEERIRHAFMSALERFEFLGAAERHKLDWTDAVHTKQRIQAFAPTLGGAVNRIAWQRGRPILKRLRRGLRRPPPLL